jgi:hypothetical protein
VLFEESAHCCHIEEVGRFLRVVNDFLARAGAAG